MPRSTSAPDLWPQEREGFVEPLRPAYAAVRCAPSPQQSRSWKLEERIGSIIAGVGLCWAAYATVTQYNAISEVGVWPLGPLEMCGVGILIWLHAKYRRTRKH